MLEWTNNVLPGPPVNTSPALSLTREGGRERGAETNEKETGEGEGAGGRTAEHTGGVKRTKKHQQNKSQYHYTSCDGGVLRRTLRC